jgi:uncharacterized OB-fold protein
VAAFCANCGAAMTPGQRFCGACGAEAGGPVPGSVAAPPATASTTSGKAIASVALAVAGFVMLPIVCSILAVVLGSQARREIDADPRLGGQSLATTGIVLGWLGLVMSVLGLLFVLLFLAQMHP